MKLALARLTHKDQEGFQCVEIRIEKCATQTGWQCEPSWRACLTAQHPSATAAKIRDICSATRIVL